MKEGASHPWWLSLYDDHLAAMLLERSDPTEVECSTDFLMQALELKPGARVMDQCCGIGSLSLPLLRRGVGVVAVDLIDSYVARTRADARAQGLEVDAHCADAFEFVATPPCDAVFNWWTSFGYAESDAENACMLERAYASLVPGGRFALDFMNVPGVLRHFQDEVITRRTLPAGELVLVRHSELDFRGGALEKRWIFTLPDGEVVRHSSRVKLYQPWDLVALSEAAGFQEVTLVGDLDGQALGLDSRRCILLARRPI